MPGKLSGGKVRISQTPPSILSKTKISSSSEVKYYGLIRDEALDDLTSSTDALEQVLEDVQDPAERTAEGEMNAADLAIIDGIVNYNIKYEDLEILKGASLKDGEGGALVSPRQRLTDRIAQFESFAGRGTPFCGAGPVRFLYTVPLNGDLLAGTVAIDTSGNVTGTGTTFSSDLETGDYVTLINSNNEEVKRLFSGDKAVYKVTGVTTNTGITIEPAPTVAITSARFKKRYSHSNPPPFYTEDITSTAFNAPDHIPSVADINKSHRQGYVLDGAFSPYKENEEWWAGGYNQDFRERSEYGGITNTPDIDPKFPIVKDGNISFEYSKDLFSQDRNFGVRYDFWFKNNFESDRTFMKWAAQVNGHIRIDQFEKTSINPSTGAVTGTWKKVLDTTDPETFNTQVTKEEPADNALGFRTYHLQGGPNYATTVAASKSNDLSATYTDKEGNNQSVFDNNYLPVVIRYWYGQDTIDNSTSPLSELLAEVQQYQPSFALDFRATNLTSALLPSNNNYYGIVKLQWVAADSEWSVLNPGTTGIEADAALFNQTFEVVGYDLAEGTYSSTRNFASWLSTIAALEVPLLSTVTGSRVYDSGLSSYKTDRLSIDIPDVSPADGDQVYVMLQNRPWSIAPETDNSNTYNFNGSDELFQKYLYSPDNLGNYENVEDLLEDGDNYVEPNPALIPFEGNTEYFRYKYGELPALGTYGVDRYDGTIYNRITSSNTDRDYDYTHNKLLFIGRQKKDTAIQPLATGEVRNSAENYTFITVEEDEAGNGGEVTILARPVNSNKALVNAETKALNSADNTETFSNSNRQNISQIQLRYFPTASNWGGTQSLRYEEFLGQKILSYVQSYSGSTPVYNTNGAIANNTMGNTDLDPDIKDLFIVSFTTNTSGTPDTYFYALIPAEKRSETAQLTLNAGGVLSSSTLFSNDNGNIVDNNQPYIGSRVEFRASGSETLVAAKYISSYDAAAEEVTVNNTTNLTEGDLYDVTIYYNYFILSGPPPTAVVGSGTWPTLGSTTSLQIEYVFNNSYAFSRVDAGSGLNFSETLFINSASAPQEFSPFGLGTELPAPPAALVTPFGYDNGPTDPNNPGLGGLCYPPYSSQNLLLQDTVKTDSELYASTEGHFDVYFGSPQVSQTNLDGKYLQVTDQLLFDFDPNERGTLIIESGTFPQFTASSYTHKLKVELSPDIDGLLSRSAYTGVANDNIFKDALKYSNNKPVKEIFFLFANKTAGNGEKPISLLIANNPGWT